jgi:hypothetical protein
MPGGEPPRLVWYKQASANLRQYLAELEGARAELRQQGVDTRATDQLIGEVRRRLAELDKLLTGGHPEG